MADATKTFRLLLAKVYGDQSVTATHLALAATDHDGGRVLFGADTQERLHVMATVETGFSEPPLHLAQVSLGTWHDASTGARYLDLVCQDPRLRSVFALVADSITERVKDQKQPAHLALLGALQDWRELLRPARQVSEDEARGLFGELYVLRLLAEHNPHFALSCWSGPEGAVHDFMSPHGELEVKTSSREQLIVTISGLDQLDPSGTQPLHLVRIRAITTGSGRTLGEMVDAVEASGCPRSSITERMARAGFLLGVDVDEWRFAVTEAPRAWRVNEEFPGLRAGDIPPGRRDAVGRIRYDLSLIGAPDPLNEKAFEDLLLYLMSGA